MRNSWQTIKKWASENTPALWVLALVLAADRISKVCAQTFLLENPVSVFPFFRLNYVENTGAAFGSFQHANGLLTVVMLVIIGYILHSWKDLCAQGKLVKWGSVLILAGAFGNLYDRITLGYVVDFLDFLVWPVFNVADSAITIGGTLFVISLFFHIKPKREEK